MFQVKRLNPYFIAYSTGITVVRSWHSHSLRAGTFANVRIKGPLQNVNCGGALDWTFADEIVVRKLANVKSAPLPFNWAAIHLD
jgi:hypothetical protein